MMEVVLFVVIIVMIVKKKDHAQFVILMELTDTPPVNQVDPAIMIAHVQTDFSMMEPITKYVNHVCGNVPLVTMQIHVSLVLKT